MDVIVEITGEKCRRCHECRDHGSAMLGHRAALNEVVPNQQQHGGDSVQSRVDRGENAVVHCERCYAAGRVVRRFTMTKQSAKTATLKMARIASEVLMEKVFIAAVVGKSAVRSASSP